jgi:two-component system CheB/CheR fusion protein
MVNTPPPFPVVGIGASAGGIEAFRGFFENMPADSGLAFIVILHLPPNRPSILADIVRRWTAMRVVEVAYGCAVEPNCIYLPPPGVAVTLRGSHLHVHKPHPDEPREFNPITVLFNSLADTLEENAIGVVLSGTGSDGALGLKAIKAKGGLTLVQGTDGTGPMHDGMPSSAIATGAVDIVAPVETLPGRIMAIQARRRRPDDLTSLSSEQLDAARLAICAILQRQVGHDFSGYKDKTFMRRVARRMQVLGLTFIDAFVARLEQDRHEAIMLFRDLLIGVTSFFRDQETFDILARDVIPLLFEAKGANATIRVWVPGCATGEEAYSLAILMREQAEALGDAAPKIQIFATDIDVAAIGTARAGRYPSALLQGLSADRKARNFVHGIDGSFTIDKAVREMCTFSAHSLMRDPPFSRMNLVSCRNLLIYLDTDLQAQVFPAFHYSLLPHGILLLGSSETVNRHDNLFTVLDRAHRIFQKRDVPTPPLRMTTRIGAREAQAAAEAGPDQAARRAPPPRFAISAQTRILERYAPAFMVISADGTGVQFSAHLSRYLELPAGLPSQNVFLMARTGLRTPLRDAVKQAADTDRIVERADVTVRGPDDRVHRVTLVVEPRRDAGPVRLFLIIFLESGGAQGDDATPPARQTRDDAAARDLEAELRDTREQLQSITEEHDTAVEELRSANEELHSVNEELQSTNEELETSKEEIQSINEELQTVNSQLATKVDELDRRNSDLRNLFESTQVATIFLDPYLIIRSFTPAIATIYNLIPSDLGRPLTDISGRLRYTRLREDCECVLQTLAPLERRVARHDDAAHYLMRILPYRSPDSTVDGTIITFVDVTSIVRAEQHQRLLVDELNHRVKNMLTVVISMASHTLRRATALEDFETTFMGRIQALTAAYSLLTSEAWQTVSLRSLLQEEFRPFMAPGMENIRFDGPAILLQPRAALALGMAVHELTTNAVKYGALSVPEGVVTVQWYSEAGQGGNDLVLDWVESGGPPVTAPSRRGFGTTLIERGLKQDMSAQVELEFPVDGVHARVRAPMPGDHLASAPDA